MKKIIISVFLFVLFNPFSVQAGIVSKDECAIWLCAPSGFPDGCSDAHNAMRKRIARGDSPLPPFKACAKDEAGMGSVYDKVVKVLAHKGCAGKGVFSDGDGGDCFASSVWIEEQFVDIPSCRYDFGKRHDFCEEGWHKLEVFQNGAQLGTTYYFRLQ